MKIVKTILEYFLHPSTWQGLIAIASAAGLYLAPELQQAIVTAGLSVVGLIQVFIIDHDKTKEIK